MFSSAHFLHVMDSPLHFCLKLQLQPGKVPGQFHCIWFLPGRNQQQSQAEDGRVLLSPQENRDFFRLRGKEGHFQIEVASSDGIAPEIFLDKNGSTGKILLIRIILQRNTWDFGRFPERKHGKCMTITVSCSTELLNSALKYSTLIQVLITNLFFLFW